jgi:hypothetical protein
MLDHPGNLIQLEGKLIMGRAGWEGTYNLIQSIQSANLVEAFVEALVRSFNDCINFQKLTLDTLRPFTIYWKV